MSFKEKIDKILSIRKIALWKLAEESGLNSTLEKAYAENREMRGTSTTKLLQNLRINQEWWNSEKGDVFLPDPEQPVDNQEDVKIKFLENGDYIGMHKRVWDRLERTWDRLERELDKKDKIIDNLQAH